MRIGYLSNIRLPTEKAHGAQIMKTCEALARAGAEVELVVTDRRSPITEDPFTYYGVERIFTITQVRTPELLKWGKAGFLMQSYIFARRAAALAAARRPDVVYTRDEIVAAATLRRRLPVVWESHTGAWNFFARLVARRCRALVVISNGLKEFYAARGIAPGKIVMAPDGVDLSAFAHSESKESARRRLGLPLDKKIAIYIGRLDGWKGTETLLNASNLLPDGIRVAIIGGEPPQIERLRSLYPRVHFLGYHPYAEVADNEAAADALVLPNTGKDVISQKYTSPLKLFSYMASGKPIVASDLPSIREILDETSACLVKADNPEMLAGGILRVLSDSAFGDSIAKTARTKVEQYTWDARAKRIVDFISQQ